MHIAYMGYMSQELKQWGVITELSKAYSISRQFIYTLINTFKAIMPQLFSPQSKEESISKKELFSKMVTNHPHQNPHNKVLQ